MRVALRDVTDLADVLTWVSELGAKTVVFDIEPLVAYWDGDRTALQDGVDRVLEKVTALPGVEVVGFATNSLRRLEVRPEHGTARVFYVHGARKPFVTKVYQDLPKPGLLVGDQVATDGVLAWRLGWAFAHVEHPEGPPRGPRLMKRLGRPLSPWLFHRTTRREGPSP